MAATKGGSVKDYLLVTAVILAFLAAIAYARGAPPPGTDPTSGLAQWFHTLTVPPEQGLGENALCCSVADCRNVRAEIHSDGHWWAYVDSKTFPDNPDNSYEGHAPNEWVIVPDNAILKRHDNPTGDAVLCWYGGMVRCFVPAGQV
jgi:hypothetical protein